MKQVFIVCSVLFAAVFMAQLQAMQIISQSKFPLTLYYICPGQLESSIEIAAGASQKIAQACCVTKIELKGYSEYAITQKKDGACSENATFIIVPEVDQVFVLQAYNQNNLTVLEFLLKNGLDPVAPLSTSQVTSSMIIENNVIKPAGIMAPTGMLRGARSGNGMQRYKALLPAAQFDQKTGMVELLQRYTSK